MVKNFFLFLFYFNCIFLIFSGKAGINNYRECICVLKNDKGSFIAIRVFDENGFKKYLAVNPDSIQTQIVSNKNFIVKDEMFESINILYKESAYIKALQEVKKTKELPYNAGFTFLSAFDNSCFLTVDLCPSNKPLDKYLFENLLEIYNSPKEIPVGIAVSGGWIKTHIDDLEYLKKLDENKSYKILWINHTYSHYYKKDLPFDKNFMLAEGINQIDEVLRNEVLMLENKIVPSVFFRFPGLISDKVLFEKVLRLGLIPLGSDAWLAKEQTPKSGSIVLVHGNGNEEGGIKNLFNYLNINKSIKFSGIINCLKKNFIKNNWSKK